MQNNDWESTTTPRSSVQRRTLVKGAAWAVPVVAVAAAAPTHAQSGGIPPNGLNGWVTLTRNCSRTTSEFQVDGRGNFTGGGASDRGIWTFVSDSSAVITFAQIIFYFNRNDAVFTNSSGSGWSNLVRNYALDTGAPATGYYAYVTTYTGTWTYFSAYGAWSADNDPYWLWNMPSRTCNAVSAYARRTITVNGTTVSFLRGPVTV